MLSCAFQDGFTKEAFTHPRNKCNKRREREADEKDVRKQEGQRHYYLEICRVIKAERRAGHEREKDRDGRWREKPQQPHHRNYNPASTERPVAVNPERRRKQTFPHKTNSSRSVKTKIHKSCSFFYKYRQPTFTL